MRSGFPNAFQCYKPRHYRVYGCICISQDERIALVRGALSGKWSFPKGHMENSETAISCASRELCEETGIVLESTQVIPMGYRKFSKEGGGYFIYRFDDEPRLVARNEAEITEGGWFSEEEMRNMPCNKDVNSFLSLVNPLIE
jgi:8-oxo-dGTP pyrophosphatase MutT (NUDIX family)